VWLRKPSDFRPTTKMPNFRLKRRQINPSPPTFWAVGVYRLPSNTSPETLARKELFETRGWPGLPFPSAKATRKQGANVCRDLTRAANKGQLRIISALGPQPARGARGLTAPREEGHCPEDYKRRACPTFLIWTSRAQPTPRACKSPEHTVMRACVSLPQTPRTSASYLITCNARAPRRIPKRRSLDDPAERGMARSGQALWLRGLP